MHFESEEPTLRGLCSTRHLQSIKGWSRRRDRIQKSEREALQTGRFAAAFEYKKLRVKGLEGEKPTRNNCYAASFARKRALTITRYARSPDTEQMIDLDSFSQPAV